MKWLRTTMLFTTGFPYLKFNHILDFPVLKIASEMTYTFSLLASYISDIVSALVFTMSSYSLICCWSFLNIYFMVIYIREYVITYKVFPSAYSYLLGIQYFCYWIMAILTSVTFVFLNMALVRLVVNVFGTYFWWNL